MKCKDIIEILEQLAPVEYAEGWDNVGFMLGDLDQEIQKILVALDLTTEVTKEAIALGVDLILTHHPFIFSGLKTITTNSALGINILDLTKNNIGVYSMHTNFDTTVMAREVAKRLNLNEITTLEPMAGKEEMQYGIGCIGKLKDSMTLEDYATYIRDTFELQGVQVYGNGDSMVSQVAVVPGSGKEYINQAKQAGCQVFVTGDITHHVGLDAIEDGMSIIDPGHCGLEKVFVPYVKEYLDGVKINIEVYTSSQGNPYRII